MVDDRWSNLSRRMVGDEEEAALIQKPFDASDPFSTARLFVQALGDHRQFRNALENLVTPESREAWADFAEVAAALEAIGDWGLGSIPTPAVGDPEVCYAKVLRGVPQTFQVTEEQIIAAAAAITLVWRSELGMWRVHAFGDAVPPELVPHSAA